MAKKRKFECLICDWKSSSFGSNSKINQEELKKAQAELDEHLKTKHSEFVSPYSNFKVIFEEPFRY